MGRTGGDNPPVLADRIPKEGNMRIEAIQVGAVPIQPIESGKRERLLRGLAAATLLIFFQAYMVAPLIPRLAVVFGVSDQKIGLIIPAYLIPYGVATLFYGLLSDYLGRWRIMRASLLAFILFTLLTATAQSASQMLLWRLLTGLTASGVVPLALALMGDLFPYERRGRPLGWLFGAMAGGAAFGATVGAILASFVGWQMLFVGVSIMGAAVFAFLLRYRLLFTARSVGPLPSLREVFIGYWSLLVVRRGLRTYGYVLWNGIFHGGVYAWLGVYLARRHGLHEAGIGLALLGYGVPGFLFGPIIGRAADRWGRSWLVPLGLGIGAVAAAMLIPHIPLVVAPVAAATLSLGYDMTQPLLGGIVTDLDEKRRGQAMGLNVFMLFVGFGLGSLLFGELLRISFSLALGLFSIVQLAAGTIAIASFRSEQPTKKEKENQHDN